jgi:hypothetical protein
VISKLCWIELIHHNGLWMQKLALRAKWTNTLFMEIVAILHLFVSSTICLLHWKLLDLFIYWIKCWTMKFGKVFGLSLGRTYLFGLSVITTAVVITVPLEYIFSLPLFHFLRMSRLNHLIWSIKLKGFPFFPLLDSIRLKEYWEYFTFTLSEFSQLFLRFKCFFLILYFSLNVNQYILMKLKLEIFNKCHFF